MYIRSGTKEERVRAAQERYNAAILEKERCKKIYLSEMAKLKLAQSKYMKLISESTI